jgi:hypothetical protein
MPQAERLNFRSTAGIDHQNYLGAASTTYIQKAEEAPSRTVLCRARTLALSTCH